jgi:hypothetical protein
VSPAQSAAPPTLDEIERTIRPLLDENRDAIEKVFATGGIAVVAGSDLDWEARTMLIALGWDGVRPVFRLSQAQAVRLADAQLLTERITGQARDAIYVRWLRDRRARRVWVHLHAANYIFRADGAQIALVAGSTDVERAEMGIAPVYVVGPEDAAPPTNSAGGDA